ncbi:MAG: ABC transporter substrate-binding protein [Chlamydiae bacterium]|jgi:manganese/zinc/iron transport system substrate-binding protein|nr:ABC transporter substrate-binding protein [Chlamydiota bacterium]
MRFLRIFWIVPLLSLLWFRTPYDTSTDLQKWMDPQSKKIHVLATTRMCASLVEKVGGDRVHVWTLIDEDLDPHSYQLVKGDKEKFRRADLVVANGLHLEHGRSLSALLKKSKTLFLGDRIYAQSPGLFLPMDEGLDPHFWMDVSLFSKSVPYIVEALQQIDPDHSGEYAIRGGELLLELDQLDHKIRVRMSKIPLEKRYLVTSHDAFQYFARRYLVDNGALGDFKDHFFAPEGVSPDGQIGAIDIQKIIQHVVKNRVLVVFAESNISKDSLNKILEACHAQGVELRLSKTDLYADSMGEESYIKMMEHNSKVIQQELTLEYGDE